MELKPRRSLQEHLRCRVALFTAPLLFISCARAPVAAPSEIGRSQQELNNPLLAVSGIYPDGWIARSGSLQLTQPPGSVVLRVRAMVPLTGDSGFSTVLELRLDDDPIARRRLGLGSFDVSVPVPEDAHTRRVTLAFDRTQALPGGDGRQIGARLESVGFERQNPSHVSATAGIVGDSHVHLGSGWGALETFGGETFRWVENDAQLVLNLGSARDAVVTLMLEPGPGAAGRPLLLRILDESGRQVGAILLDRRQTFRVPLALRGAGTEVFKLHVDGGGTKIPSDSRVLNFRAFAVEVEPWADRR
jgi:hypothetical protein